jgi:hypothetical protein
MAGENAFCAKIKMRAPCERSLWTIGLIPPGGLTIDRCLNAFQHSCSNGFQTEALDGSRNEALRALRPSIIERSFAACKLSCFGARADE